METPVKKWQQMSPMQDELAIVESSDSAPQEPELFSALILDSPCSLALEEGSFDDFSIEEEESSSVSQGESSSRSASD